MNPGHLYVQFTRLLVEAVHGRSSSPVSNTQLLVHGFSAAVAVSSGAGHCRLNQLHFSKVLEAFLGCNTDTWLLIFHSLLAKVTIPSASAFKYIRV
ncbi:hypothetical protein FRX31_010313 [Thalictrum thalictroides]|uniref:Uncharacterized protein n=1 Tax=Thalictrum thalictroides TaxID=46969 RepID=A0A7J6WRT6_THATH|nr:hypothetical protein FRX31_010313 [Thalictrum thalictroides]